MSNEIVNKNENVTSVPLLSKNGKLKDSDLLYLVQGLGLDRDRSLELADLRHYIGVLQYDVIVDKDVTIKYPKDAKFIVVRAKLESEGHTGHLGHSIYIEPDQEDVDDSNATIFVIPYPNATFKEKANHIVHFSHFTETMSYAIGNGIVKLKGDDAIRLGNVSSDIKVEIPGANSIPAIGDLKEPSAPNYCSIGYLHAGSVVDATVSLSLLGTTPSTAVIFGAKYKCMVYDDDGRQVCKETIPMTMIQGNYQTAVFRLRFNVSRYSEYFLKIGSSADSSQCYGGRLVGTMTI